MGAYTAFLSLASFVAAVCAGFMLAASPRQRATQLAASLAAGAAWWSLCEARWNSAPDAATALLWMRLACPGWCFLGAIVPHLMARYLDLYPSLRLERRRRLLLRMAGFGYAVGIVVIGAAWLGRSVHGEIQRVPWGFSYAPGPVQIAFLAAITPGIVFAVATMLRHVHSPLAVAPRGQRVAIRIGILTPVVLTPLTDVLLPIPGQAERSFLQRHFVDFREAKFHLNIYPRPHLLQAYARHLCRAHPTVGGVPVSAVRIAVDYHGLHEPAAARRARTVVASPTYRAVREEVPCAP